MVCYLLNRTCFFKVCTYLIIIDKLLIIFITFVVVGLSSEESCKFKKVRNQCHSIRIPCTNSNICRCLFCLMMRRWIDVFYCYGLMYSIATDLECEAIIRVQTGLWTILIGSFFYLIKKNYVNNFIFVYFFNAFGI